MIRRLQLKGLVSFGESESVVEFGHGKNVIVGENATGKSALLIAIELGFLGSVGGRNLSEVINDDVEEGEVTIDFIHPGSGAELRLYRRIRRNRGGEDDQASQTEVRLENLVTGETIAERPTEVDKALQKLGIDKNVFSTLVLIRQGEIDRILRPSSEQRDTLNKLLGIADLEQAYHEIGGSRGGQPAGILREIDHKKSILMTQKQEKEHIAADALVAQDRLRQLRSDAAILTGDREKLVNALSESQIMWKAVQPILERLEIADHAVQLASAVCEQQQGRLSATISQIERRIGSTDRDRRDFSSLLTHDLLSKAATVKRVLKQRLDEIENRRSDLQVLGDERSKLEVSISAISTGIAIRMNSIGEAKARIRRVVEFLEGRRGQPEIVCDLCGSRLDESHYQAHLLGMQSVLENEEGLVSSDRKELEKIQGRRLIVQQAIDKIESMALEKEALQSLLVPLETDETTVRQGDNERRSLESMINDIIRDGESLLGQIVSLEELRTKANGLKTDMSTIPVRIEGIEKEVRAAESQIGSLEQQIQTMLEAKKDAEILQKRVQEYEARMNLLTTEIRPSLRDIQPIIRRIFLNRVNGRAMEYFNRFYANASKYKRTDIGRIWVDNDYHFWAERLGHTKSCSRLSGGQSIVVSLSFLFAFLDELGGALGFLLLDEPSNHLDQKRIEELINAFQELQNVPQLIIVDHREELAQSADRTYRATLREGFSYIEQVA